MSDEIHQLYAVYGWSVVALLDVCGDLRGRCLTFGARRSSDQPATEQRLERFGQVSTDVVLFDVDLLEEGLVEQSPGLGAGGEVGRVAVASVAECGSEVLLDYFQVGPVAAPVRHVLGSGVRKRPPTRFSLRIGVYGLEFFLATRQQ
ncbi:hypothetical protein ACTD5D_37225 [Nocardia takedensis]|uniref:hypothetical protein n=1 Tax=Nocardia takedensis TaxID=259390 RepID=UPI003F76F821